MKAGKNVFVEILMFLGVYFVTNLVLNIVATPFLLVAMFTDPDYLAATATGDVAAVVTATEKLIQQILEHLPHLLILEKQYISATLK